MHAKRWLVIGFVGMLTGLGSRSAQAGDLKITIPKRSTLTPVQRLNREGVEAIRKHNYAKAEQLFYKAYLFDPDDAFTLNNLGYISELQGQIDRAQRFYSLAAEQSSEAVIDRASARRVEGRPMKDALALADQCAVMLGGTIAQSGPAAEVFGRPSSAEVARFLGVA